MLKLIERKPEWTEVLPGVRILFTPITRVAIKAARRKVAELLRESEVANGGAEIDEIGDVLSAELMQRGILDWEGVGDAEGVVTPVTPANVALLLADPIAFEAIERAYITPWVMQSAEKNGLSASPNGIGEAATGAADTASSAADATMAPAATPARTRSKRSEVKPANASGTS